MGTRLPSVIPSVWTDAQRDLAAASPWPLVHAAGGTLRSMEAFIEPLRARGKTLWVHPDMIAGLAKDREGLSWVKDRLRPHAIVTSNLVMAQLARQLGVRVVLRIFVHDTQSLESGLAAIDRLQPDVICCLPAVVYPVIKAELDRKKIPVVAAGLIRTPEQRDQLLSLGVSVEIGKSSLWQSRGREGSTSDQRGPLSP